MPNLQRRPHTLAQRQSATVTSSTKSNATMEDELWYDDLSYHTPSKEMNGPSTPLGRVPSRKQSLNNLRIIPYAQPDILQERYMSSEEEPSPSPESETDSQDEEEELRHKSDKSAESRADQVAELSVIEEYTAEIAIAVPIMAIGRPKLVDITNIAPMHKRIRTEKSMLTRVAAKKAVIAASRLSAINVASTPVSALPSPALSTSSEKLPKRKDSLPMSAPESWLPEEDNVHIMGEEDDYLPELELRNPPTYKDYDPYEMNPPRLSPRNSYSTGAIKKPGSIAHARKQSNPPVAMNNAGSWKGLTRSLSLAKRQEAINPARQVTKKSRMLTRGATERRHTPLIPPFPFEAEEAAA